MKLERERQSRCSLAPPPPGHAPLTSLSRLPLPLQPAHYQACLDVFTLSPGRPARELGELAMFVAQVREEGRETKERGRA